MTLSQLLCWHRGPGIFWFRLFGYGPIFLSYATHRPLFSERHGYLKVLRLGTWRARWLGPPPDLTHDRRVS